MRWPKQVTYAFPTVLTKYDVGPFSQIGGKFIFAPVTFTPRFRTGIN